MKGLQRLAMICVLAAGSPAHPEATSDSAASLQQVRELLDAGKYARADSLAERLLPQIERSAGARSLEYARALDLAVRARDKTGRATQPQSLRLAERAVAIKQSRLRPDDPEIAISVLGLAGLQESAADYRAARANYIRALNIQERAYGARHVEVATTLNALGGLLSRMCEYDSAQVILERGLSIREQLLGPEHVVVAQSLNVLAVNRFLCADVVASRKYAERALRIRETALGPKHPDVAGPLNNMAALLMKMGEFAAAEPYLVRALEIREANLDSKSPYIASTIANLGWLHFNLGDLDGAAQRYETAIAMLRESVGEEHPMMSTAFTGYARVLQRRGDRKEARQYFERALHIREARTGKSSHDVADCLLSMSQLDEELGDSRSAATHARRALEIHEGLYGSDHYMIARELVALGTSLARCGETEAAMQAALRAEAIGCEYLRATIRALPEREALRFATVRDSGRDLALSLVGRATDPRARKQVWDAVLRSRGLILDEMAERHRWALRARDPDVGDAVRRLSNARLQLANLMVRPADFVPESYPRLVEAARSEVESAERAVALQRTSITSEALAGTVTMDDLQRRLRDREVLVAVAVFDRLNLDLTSDATGKRIDSDPDAARSQREYVAFVLRHGYQAPRVVPLGNAERVDSQVRAWQSWASRPPSEEGVGGATSVSGDQLRRSIWDPLQPYIADAKRVYFVPDGRLHLVNLYALPTSDSQYLVEKGVTIQWLSTERDLAGPRGSTPPVSQSLLALGGPDFDLGVPGVAASGSNTEVAQRQPAVHRGAVPPCDDFRSLRFEPLPASMLEAQRIADLWSRWSRPSRDGAAGKVTCLTGPEATEANFKRKASGHSAIHVATHGFFLEEECVIPVEDARGIGTIRPRSDVDAGKQHANPLQLAGLALSGANRRDAVDETQEDGILTAEEIATLDLLGTDLVVLSACQSGVGPVQAGEGVFGLRRAFQHAGARTVVMSLWPVRDDLARRWMEQLYELRLTQGRDTATAVRETSLALLHASRSAGGGDHPSAWAAFVATGAVE